MGNTASRARFRLFCFPLFLGILLSSCVVCSASGEGRTSNCPGKSTARGNATREPDAERLLQSTLGRIGAKSLRPTAAWVIDGTETNGGVAVDTHWELLGKSLRRQRLPKSGTQELLVASDAGGQSQRSNQTVKVPRRIAEQWIVPAAIATILLNDSNASCASIGSVPAKGSSGSSSFEVVRHDDAMAELVSSHRWSISASDGLPDGLVVHQHDASHSDRFELISFSFSDYRSVQGVMVPFRIAVSASGKVISTVTISAVDFSDNIPQDRFALSK
jgi:hypothetical protein